jgi:hypothetical protein
MTPAGNVVLQAFRRGRPEHIPAREALEVFAGPATTVLSWPDGEEFYVRTAELRAALDGTAE